MRLIFHVVISITALVILFYERNIKLLLILIVESSEKLLYKYIKHQPSGRSNAYLHGGGVLAWFWVFPGESPYAARPAEGIALDGTSGDDLTTIPKPKAQ